MYKKFSIICQLITILAGLISLAASGKIIHDNKKQEPVDTDYREVK